MNIKGAFHSIDLPVFCRQPCFRLYSFAFNCNLEEINCDDLNEFKNMSEFFRRSLKSDARIVDYESCLVSPCDGKILNLGKVDNGYLTQVKGVTYSLKGFLGEQNWPLSNRIKLTPSQPSNDDHVYEKNIRYNPGNSLYYCVIYLAPGDYHRFHSPADWNMHFRRHIPGKLFGVNQSVAKRLEGLYSLNERVVYYGDWKYGFFSMTAVGATNVGSIKVYIDEVLTILFKNFVSIIFKDTILKKINRNLQLIKANQN